MLDKNNREITGMNVTQHQQHQYLSCLHTGQPVNIQRSNGRVHPAVVTFVNFDTKMVTVEWQEKSEDKGKEVDIDAVIQLNPSVFASILHSSSYTGFYPQHNGSSVDADVMKQSVRRSRQQSRQDRDSVPQHMQAPSTTRSISVSNAMTPTPFHASPQRHANPSGPSGEGRKSRIVKDVERMANNREQRRAEHRSRRQRASDIDQSIPAWEFQAMVNEYRQQLDVKLLTAQDQQKDLKICVCVRKRPITRNELNKKDIDVLTVPTKDVVIVHVPKVKLDLTKYIDNQKFRFDYTFHESCKNELVYQFTAKPLVESLFQGTNPMVFAYGQTGSGTWLIDHREH